MRNSPLARSESYISKLNDLSREGTRVEKVVNRARRDAADLAAKYSGDFTVVLEIHESAKDFSDVWFIFYIIIQSTSFNGSIVEMD